MNTNNLVYHIFAYLRKIGMHRVDTQDPRIQEMHRTIQALERSAIKFEVKSNPDGGWTAKSTNIAGILTGGDKASQMESHIRDAVFTYFDIPPSLCDSRLLLNSPAMQGENEALDSQENKSKQPTEIAYVHCALP